MDKDKYWDKAWSLVEGCTPVSEGCAHCWLESIAHRFQKEISCDDGSICNLTNYDGKWAGDVVMMPNRLDIPSKTKTSQVFAIWSDLFHEKVSDDFIIKAFNTMGEQKTEKHKFLILTKRPERLLKFWSMWQMSWWTDNIYLGTTCENQQRFEERFPFLMEIPGNKFLSVEPLLEEINLFTSGTVIEHGEMQEPEYIGFPDLDQVIVGAESGSHRRPCNIEWIRSIVRQCKDAQIPCFVKQIHDEKGRVIKDINLFPEDLRVRELAWK